MSGLVGTVGGSIVVDGSAVNSFLDLREQETFHAGS